jgi:peroxiredoxin
MNLKDGHQHIYEEGRGKRPADETEVMDRAAKALVDTGQAERATNIGDTAPGFSLPNATGDTVNLSDLLIDGPVVLSFYRGNWCPSCNLELRTLQANIGEFEARGARLVAISPQVPDESLSVSEKHDLTFEVLSDVGTTVARSYGLSFDIPAELAAIYESRGHDLIRANGGHDRTLVIPASYIVGQDGIVSWAFVNSDHTRRAEPSDMIAALDGLRRTGPGFRGARSWLRH